MADVQDVHSLRVVDLRDRLKDLGVNHRGRKAELQARLIAVLEQQARSTPSVAAAKPSAPASRYPEKEMQNTDERPKISQESAVVALEHSGGASGGAKQPVVKRRGRKRRRRKATTGSTTPSTTIQSAFAFAYSPSDRDLSGKVVNGGAQQTEAVPTQEAFQEVFRAFESMVAQKQHELAVDEGLEDAIPRDGQSGPQKELEREGDEGELGVAEAARRIGEGQAPLSLMSNRRRRALLAPSLASLKARAPRPEVIETHDSTAADPVFLAFLKAYRNTVSIPRHWSRKRKYMQGKRGVERGPFVLPQFIADTGIGALRDALAEADQGKSLKQRMREQVRPKTGQLAIEPDKLYDAFFRYYSKPKLSGFGELYFEGREYVKMRAGVRPGRLSARLRRALGMGGPLDPPPWLLGMQRYGPPPSYQQMRVPGVNAPIPPATTYGYHAGGWGKPPVDHNSQPVYGNPFDAPNPADFTEAEVDQGQGGSVAGEGAEMAVLPSAGRRSLWGRPAAAEAPSRVAAPSQQDYAGGSSYSHGYSAAATVSAAGLDKGLADKHAAASISGGPGPDTVSGPGPGHAQGLASVASVASSVAVPTPGLSLRKESPFVVLEEQKLSAHSGALQGAMAPTHAFAVPQKWKEGQSIVEAARYASGGEASDSGGDDEPASKRARVG